MDQEGPSAAHIRPQSRIRVNWKKFFVYVSGKTGGAHCKMVDNLKSCGQTEVSVLEDSDYILLFCVISSRVGTDIGEALENAPGGKKKILVVMHHTFNHDYITGDSRRLVEDNSNVCLVVDCFFHERKLLQCNRNDIALSEIKKFLRISPAQKFTSSAGQKKVLIGCGVVVCLGVLALIIWAVANRQH